MFLQKFQIYWSDLLVVFTLSIFYWANLLILSLGKIIWSLFVYFICSRNISCRKIANKFEQEKVVIIKSTGKSDR